MSDKHFTILYCTEKTGGKDTPLSKCPTFHTFAPSSDMAIKQLFDTVPDVVSGAITQVIPVTRRI